MNCFGGASSEEKGNAAAEDSLARSLSSAFGERFGMQSDTMKQLNGVIQQIRTGQTGPGFGAEEEAAYRTDIINNTAAGTRNAEQAAANEAAGQQFPDAAGSERVSGIRQQINAGIVASGENEKSALLRRNAEMNATQGRINAATTAGGLERLSGIEDPLGYARSAESANEGAFKMNNEINKENSSGGLFGSLLSAGVGLAGKAISGGIAGGGGFMDTFKGALGGVTGQDLFGK